MSIVFLAGFIGVALTISNKIMDLIHHLLLYLQ